MGLFTKSNSGSSAAAPNLDGLSDEAKRLALQKAAAATRGGEAYTSAGDATDLVAPPPAGLAAALAAKSLPPTSNAPQTERQRYFQQLKVRMHQQLVERLDVQNLRQLPPEVVRSEVRVLIRDLCQNER